MTTVHSLATSQFVRRPFLDELRIDYGPVDLLGRFFLKADEAALARGISLSFATFDELIATNKANADSWKPIVTVFDLAYNKLGPETAFCIVLPPSDIEMELYAAKPLVLVSFRDQDSGQKSHVALKYKRYSGF